MDVNVELPGNDNEECLVNVVVKQIADNPS
jgi:hypothetical protein